MKTYFGKPIMTFFLFILAFLNLFSQSKNGFDITGDIQQIKDGKVYLKLFYGKGFNDYTTVDSTVSKDGKFHFRGEVPSGPRLYWIDFASLNFFESIVLFLNNNEHVTIRTLGDSLIHAGNLSHSLIIEGSQSNHAWDCLVPVVQTYTNEIKMLNGYLRSIKDSVGFDPSLVSGILTAKNKINETIYTILLEKMSREYRAMIPYFLYDRGDVLLGHVSFLPDVYSRFTNEEKNSFYGKLVLERLPLCVGQPFPVFTLPQPDGKIIALKELIEKNKMTIVHFWADQSVDRKNYEDELKVFYKKYKDKGLAVVGFSSDKYADLWKDVVQKDQLSWYNVSDLRGEDGMVNRVYHEYGDPEFTIRNTTNVLIDSSGKIVAWDVSGLELQWYLWKYLDR